MTEEELRDIERLLEYHKAEWWSNEIGKPLIAEVRRLRAAVLKVPVLGKVE